MGIRCSVVFVLGLGGLAGLVGCGSAQVGVQEAALPVDSAAQCKSHCQTIGLTLDSVVLMANTVGCVCRAAPAAGGSPGAAASSGGMAAILLAQQAAQAEQDEQAKQQRAQDEAQKQQQAQPPSPPASP